jgi:hypothetical protein
MMMMMRYELLNSKPTSSGLGEIYKSGYFATIFFFYSFSGWGETESTWYVGRCWPIAPAPNDRWWYYRAVGGIRIGRGNRSTRIKPAPVPLCPLHIPHDLTWDRTRAAAVGSQRLTAWAMARPSQLFYFTRLCISVPSCPVIDCILKYYFLIYLYIYGLLNDAFNSSDYMASNERVIS